MEENRTIIKITVTLNQHKNRFLIMILMTQANTTLIQVWHIEISGTLMLFEFDE